MSSSAVAFVPKKQIAFSSEDSLENARYEMWPRMIDPYLIKQ